MALDAEMKAMNLLSKLPDVDRVAALDWVKRGAGEGALKAVRELGKLDAHTLARVVGWANGRWATEDRVREPYATTTSVKSGKG